MIYSRLSNFKSCLIYIVAALHLCWNEDRELPVVLEISICIFSGVVLVLMRKLKVVGFHGSTLTLLCSVDVQFLRSTTVHT